jgi:hypothetical protein
MAKTTVPYAAVGGFQAAGFVPCRDGEESDLQFDRDQAKWVRHWHEGPPVEEQFRREEKREINLKWKQRKPRSSSLVNPIACCRAT